MSRPPITDQTVDALGFARACVLDQRVTSHKRNDHQWDAKYRAALEALDAITNHHQNTATRRERRAGKRQSNG